MYDEIMLAHLLDHHNLLILSVRAHSEKSPLLDFSPSSNVG
ncbi:MAG: hypothetical protein VXZ83_01495 [Verrucomicrobiota bacterium]|nr:hypothetical protein [Verrucomicrobiota bacterium]